VWTFDKRSAEIDRLSPMARDKTMDVLKSEVRRMPSGTADGPLMNVNA
jgi:hypothetical protein